MKEIFGGEHSRKMWEEINNAETIEDVKDAMYTICCRLQEFEAMVSIDRQVQCPICGEEYPTSSLMEPE